MMIRTALFCVALMVCNMAHGQITKYPLLEYSSADNLIIKEVNLMNGSSEENYTVISFELSPVQDEFFMIPKGTYINDATDTRNRYELICFYNEYYKLGEWYPIKSGEVYSYSLIFEKIDVCTESINIYEPQVPNTEPWVWQNIRIKNNCGQSVN